MENMPKYWISGKQNTANFCWLIGLLLCKYVSNEENKIIIIIAIKIAIIPYILITVVTYIALGIAVIQKKPCISHF